MWVAGVRKWDKSFTHPLMAELRAQARISLPLMAMNSTFIAKSVITTAFLGRLGSPELAGGTLGITFANVTGYSILNGLCYAMEPLCGQAHGAKNYRLLHKTLFMTFLLLLLASIPISLLWFFVDHILLLFGQRQDISTVAKTYLLHLLPDLLVVSFLFPLRSYLCSQGSTLPVMFTSATAAALHLPLNILMVRARGIHGVSMAVWATNLSSLVLLALYVGFKERRGGGWWEQGKEEWVGLLKLSLPCCLNTCMEWWCWEILVLMAGRLRDDPGKQVGVIAIALNFDYVLFSVMQSTATCVSARVANELGANRGGGARAAARMGVATAAAMGVVGAGVTAAVKGEWGRVFSEDEGVRRGVERVMRLMAWLELGNFPLAVCGGVVRGTGRPGLAVYPNLVGFYGVALPVGVGMGFGLKMELIGLVGGFLVGVMVCLSLMLVLVLRVDWDEEANKAQMLAGGGSGGDKVNQGGGVMMEQGKMPESCDFSCI